MITSPQLPDSILETLDLAPDWWDRFRALILAVNSELLAYYNNPESWGVEHKDDDSPITRADSAAHKRISEGLSELAPHIPILSEESSVEEVAARAQWNPLWIVDPLDGTKEFIGRTGEFTVNIALVINQRPVFGAIAMPVDGLLYVGIPGTGIWKAMGENLAHCIQLPSLPPVSTDSIRLVASQRHSPMRVAAQMAKLEPFFGNVERIDAGSAVKFCSLVEGEAQIYPRTSPCYEWDVAAGDALVHAAGGQLGDASGRPLLYNARDTLLVDYFFAASDTRKNWVSMLHGDKT